MKNFVIGIFLIILSFVVLENKASADNLYPIDYEFTITFNQPVDLQQFEKYVYVSNELKDNLTVAYTIRYGSNEKIVKLSPIKSWEYGNNYKITFNENMPDKKGTKLKTTTTFSFTIISNPNPNYNQEEIFAPISPTLKEYLDENFQQKPYLTASYYYSTDIELSLINQYSQYFEKEVLPYMYKLFPSVKEYKKNPTFVFLGNHKEQATVEFGKHFYGDSSLPYGWYSSAYNITVMTQLGYEPPYNKINTILFPHEYFHWVNKNVYQSTIPSWLNEGIAYNFSWALYYKNENFMESSLYDKNKQNFLDNETIEITDSRAYMVVTAYIQGIYGQHKLEQLVKRSATENFALVFKEIYGKNIDEMMAEARQYIKNEV